jgi:hypothetical protein
MIRIAERITGVSEFHGLNTFVQHVMELELGYFQLQNVLSAKGEAILYNEC